jgi:thiosulfate reductase cytochrome b subunit
MKVIKEKHPLAMRWTHWVNFPILTIMIWSGMLIYWANDIYSITIFGHTFFRFFPDWFYNALHIPSHLAEGMAFHFLFMWFFTLNGIFYIIYTIISGEWRQLVPNRHSFKEAWLVVLHDLHIRKTAPPQDKYNAAQRIAYTSIIVMGFGSVVTGLAIYKPVQFYYLTWICGGYHFARILHFALTIGYVLFFVIHIVQVILAGWNNFRSVVSGFEIVEEAPATALAMAPGNYQDVQPNYDKEIGEDENKMASKAVNNIETPEDAAEKHSEESDTNGGHAL